MVKGASGEKSHVPPDHNWSILVSLQNDCIDPSPSHLNFKLRDCKSTIRGVVYSLRLDSFTCMTSTQIMGDFDRSVIKLPAISPELKKKLLKAQ
jgi:hypothetical protein